MAAGTIASEIITLVDDWPAAPVTMSIPLDGFTGASHHNVSAAAYPYGSKVIVYSDGSAAGSVIGFSTLVYLQLGTQDATAMAAGDLCLQGSATLWYQVTDDAGTALAATSGPIAISLSAMTNSYFGWFWCGGVCPQQYVSALDGTFPTEAVVIGPMSVIAASQEIVFTVATTLKNQVGYTLANQT